MRRRTRLVTIFCVLLVSGEGLLRLLGYGDPVLYQLDEQIEYMARPGVYHRFGNEIRVNAYSMRGEELSSEFERRVLLIGDSIVFGTNRLDQSELISQSLRSSAARLGLSSKVLNIAAPSWGPPNQLAYLERFGTFGAEDAVWLMSSHDLTDAPSAGYPKTLPKEKPHLALFELFSALQRRLASAAQPPNNAHELVEESIRKVVSLLHAQGLRLTVALHPSVHELRNGSAEMTRLRTLLLELKVETVELAPVLRRNDGLYEDALHLSAAGTALVGRALAPLLIANPQDRGDAGDQEP